MIYKLEDLFDLQMGKTPSRNNPNYWNKKDNKWISIADLSKCEKYITDTKEHISNLAVKESGISQIPPNTVIMSFKLSIGKIAITKEAIYSNEAIMAFKDKQTIELFPDYIYYLLSSQKWDEGTNKAVMGKTLNKATLSKIKIDVHNVSEQWRITRELDKIIDLIQKRKQQLSKLDELVKARFVEMFGGMNDSKSYPYKAVKELTEVISGGTPSREVNEYWEGGTIPWVKTTELQNNTISETEEYITKEGLDNSSAKLVPAGTVLIAMYGQGKTRGMTGYLGVEACTNQACACILPSENINQKFLWQYFVLSYDNLRGMAKGGNQPNLNGNIIKTYPVLYPPIELQNQFATFVEQTDKSKLEIQKSLEKLEMLKKALMQKYFG